MYNYFLPTAFDFLLVSFLPGQENKTLILLLQISSRIMK